MLGKSELCPLKDPSVSLVPLDTASVADRKRCRKAPHQKGEELGLQWISMRKATDVLFGADWGDLIKNVDVRNVQQQQNDQDVSNLLRSSKLVEPLQEGKVPYKIHVVKDFDRKERICLEAERLKLSALVMGDCRNSMRRRTGADSITEYCMHHCECPVLVVRYNGDDNTWDLTNQAAALYLDSKI
ncbi:hypothetical protein GOP47_0020751 [Adiantum capillus-veneris]|uniref:UspA domain-containing protein n=1 Tax=Adiantum capillus-veneris TaxID=13818 RepID=A0A9D4UBM8_ADICA|nr:hypothetical protein GOP47_0020751 [Adiantum capillus-veneris]